MQNNDKISKTIKMLLNWSTLVQEKELFSTIFLHYSHSLHFGLVLFSLQGELAAEVTTATLALYFSIVFLLSRSH